ncbi:MAG: hypothetical protein LBR60_07200 [Fibrobacter sp.]|jgi:hypothetical protein|nr:hypothetical protein [Fibrobacter sp.]
MKYRWLAVWACVLLGACQESEKLADLDLTRFTYSERKPVFQVKSPHARGEWKNHSRALADYSFQGMADMVYETGSGDSLEVTLLEFENDIYALGFYRHSGLFQEAFPIIKGDKAEQSLRAGNRIFVFRYNRFRHYERAGLEKYVREFSGEPPGLPPEFLSFPFQNKEPGAVFIQTRFFHGVPVREPLLIQRYHREGIYWNVARSWKAIPDAEWKTWISGLKGNGNAVNALEGGAYFFRTGYSFGLASRLPDGRFLSVWGPFDLKTLKAHYETAREAIYKSRY